MSGKIIKSCGWCSNTAYKMMIESNIETGLAVIGSTGTVTAKYCHNCGRELVEDDGVIIPTDDSLIIPSGETLCEVMEDRLISTDELSVKTGFTTEYIFKVLDGKEDITDEFSVQLESVLGIPSYFWMNLQKQWEEERALTN